MAWADDGIICYVSSEKLGKMNCISVGTGKYRNSDNYVSKVKTGAFRTSLYRVQNIGGEESFYCTGKERSGFRKGGYHIGDRVGYASHYSGSTHTPLFRAYEPATKSYLCTTAVKQIDETGPTLLPTEVEDYVRKFLKDHLKANVQLWMADKAYFCTTRKVAESIIKESKVVGMTARSQSFDCDDFAHLMKAAFIKDIYYRRRRSNPYAFGILWGVSHEKPLSAAGATDQGKAFEHALNFVIVSDGNENDFTLYVVEPKDGTWYTPEEGMITDVVLVVC